MEQKLLEKYRKLISARRWETEYPDLLRGPRFWVDTFFLATTNYVIINQAMEVYNKENKTTTKSKALFRPWAVINSIKASLKFLVIDTEAEVIKVPIKKLIIKKSAISKFQADRIEKQAWALTREGIEAEEQRKRELEQRKREIEQRKQELEQRKKAEEQQRQAEEREEQRRREREEQRRREREEQELKMLLETLPEILPDKDVPLATIQQRILGNEATAEETEQRLLQLQKEGTLPGQYDRITQTFRRKGEAPATLKVIPSFSTADPTCRFCGSLLLEESDLCPDCGQKVSSCPVCRKQISFGQVVGMCSYCFTPYHEGHLLEALKIQGKCPVCQTDISEAEIIRQDLGKKKTVSSQ
ncbi:MAG: hypothetical protein ACE5OZ_04380 [Candidatus Heimdallarchaeota archaeon]